MWLLSGMLIGRKVDADWELLKPQEEKDITHSFNYLLIESGAWWRVMHLAYLGRSNDEHLFIGVRAFATLGEELIFNDPDKVNSLVSRDGLIQKNILDITERKHIPHPEDDSLT